MTDFARRELGELLDGLASKSPAPGGGAVAPIVAALGAALAQMVVAYSQGRKKLVEHDALHQEAMQQLTAWRTDALELARADEVAYGRLNTLWKLPEDDPARLAGFTDAVRGAIEVPSRAVDLALELGALVARLDGATNRMLASDLEIAGMLAEVAARAAACNVRVNLPMVADEVERIELEQAIDERLAQLNA